MLLLSKFLELCFPFQACNKLSLGYGKVMMKAIRGDSTERIWLIFLYVCHALLWYLFCLHVYEENYEETN